MNKTIIKLDEDDFRCIVSGGILIITDSKNKHEISIYLSDIGFHVMDKAIDDVDSGKIPHYSDRKREL